MTLLTPLLALALLTLVIAGLARLCVGRQGELLTGLFRAPDLGWPRGVQEEDPPPEWRLSEHATAQQFLDDTPEPPPAIPVRPGAIHRPVRG